MIFISGFLDSLRELSICYTTESFFMYKFEKYSIIFINIWYILYNYNRLYNSSPTKNTIHKSESMYVIIKG